MKILSKTLLTTAILFSFATIVSAQVPFSPVKFGIKAGMNLANFSGDQSSDAKLKYQAGITIDINLPANFYIASGLEFTAKGAKSDIVKAGNKAEVKYNPLYLQVPLRLGYKVGLIPTMKLVFNAGPYYAYGIGGKAKFAGDFGDIKAGTKVGIFSNNVLDYKRSDFGIGLGTGLEFLGRVSANLGYDFGLTNISGDSNNKVRNQNAYFTVGLKF